MILQLLLFLWLFVNIVFVLPLAIYIFYTTNQVFPLLVAVEDHDRQLSETIPLPHHADQSSGSASPQTRRAWPILPALRSLLRLLNGFLYSHAESVPIIRGLGWFLLWNLIKHLITFAALRLPWVLGFLVQISLPLAITQLHTFWVHTLLLAKPSSKSFFDRFISIKQACRVVALPMILLLTAEASVHGILQLIHQRLPIRGVGAISPVGKFALLSFIFACLTVAVVAPFHLLLVRVEASLLPAEEETTVQLDPALIVVSSETSQGHEILLEVGKSVKWRLVFKLLLTYLKIVLVTTVLSGLIGFLDFSFYISLVMAGA